MTNQSSKNDKIELEKRLAKLIGFDEVSGLLEHSLSFQTGDELLEYMSSLLGQSGHNIQQFCLDIGKYKNGEPISKSSEEKEDSAAPSKPARKPLDYSIGSAVNTQKEKKGNFTNARKNKQGKATKREQLQRRKTGKNLNRNIQNPQNGKIKQQPNFHPEASSLSTQTKKDAVRTTVSTSVKEPPSTVATTESSATLKTLSSLNTALSTKFEIKPLARGKAEIVCGCLGTVHEPLINCLHCGYILCKLEGYGFCPSCGFEVENNSYIRSMGVDEKSQQHKDRLLKFDREFTQRTKVYDDQADYFVNSTSMWLSEKEQQESLQKENQRRKDLHERKKQVLKIDFD